MCFFFRKNENIFQLLTLFISRRQDYLEQMKKIFVETYQDKVGSKNMALK